MGNVNSYLCMPEFVDTPLAVERPGTPRGAITRHEIPGNGHIAGAGRAVHLYQPPAAHPVPLLVVLDGSEYREKASLATIVDNLIHESRIVPLAMALADNGGQARVVEYACNDATVAFILQDVLDLARQRLNLLDVGQSPGAFGIMGASMGGLMSLYTALRAPEVFGHVLCESGAFGADRLYHRSVLYDLIRATDPPPLSIWMDVGLHEWFLHPNREIHRLLRDRGYRVAYREQTSGHNYPSWRNVLWRGLEHLFPR
jgi:enterochelin esterase family protein